MQFFLLDLTYKIERGKPYIYLYGRADGKKITIKHAFAPYFYVDKEPSALKDLTLEEKGRVFRVERFERVEKELLGEKKEFWKVFVNIPKAAPLISQKVKEMGFMPYENNILFVYRYLRDLDLKPFTYLEATGVWENEVFFASSVKQSEGEYTPHIMAFDIETYAKTKAINPQANPILFLALTDSKGYKKVLTWKEFPHELDYLEVVADEKALLVRFVEIMQEMQPDILTGYFSDGFDFPYIQTRAEKLGVKMSIGINNTLLNVRDRESKVEGIVHLDLLPFVKYIFGMTLKTDSYSLNAVSNELLGSTKHDVDIADLNKAWDKNEGLEEFAIYNLQDTDLTLRLCQLLLSDMLAFSHLLGLPLTDTTRMRFSRLVENYILKRAKNILAPNKPSNYELEQRMRRSVQGAFVYEPIPGVYEDLVVFDFRSLYPTVITAHNISPESFQCDCCNEKVPERKDYWFCQKKKAFLPSVLAEIIDLRTGIKKQLKKNPEDAVLKARSYALKILANSFYGYLGFYGARWYSLPSAASTTAYARTYIKDTMEKAKEKGFGIAYGDTDSLFVKLNNKTKDAAIAFMEDINKTLPGQMELEMEGYYPRGIFVAVKGTDKGAKKRYALLKEDGNLKITGFELVRRNTIPLAKEVQKEVLRLVLTKEEKKALLYVRETVKELQEKKIPQEKLAVHTRLTRDLTEYSSIGPHVAVARRMQERGEKVGKGTRVAYIITPGTGLIRDRARIVDEAKDYDVPYYLKHHLLPALGSIFAVLGYEEDALTGDTRQEGLGKFF